MRFEGTLTKWNDDRGFGFITPKHGDQEIFVHISAFPKDGRRPNIGEVLSFEFEVGQDGKKEAKNLVCPGRPPTVRKQSSHHTNSPTRRASLISRALTLMFIVLIGVFAYDQISRRSFSATTAVAMEGETGTAPIAVPSPPSIFRCDGRQHCSQMNSCAEAKYFLKNCPDTKMDGDHDLIPCEQTLCASAFVK
jgi:cold shock CspA family protein